MEISQMTLLEAAKGLADKRWSAQELTEAAFAKAKPNQLNAYVAFLDEAAKSAAIASDERRASGRAKSPLDGIPLAIKDNILVAGAGATSGSNILRNYVATYDATVVERLKGAGAVIFAKTNLDEFAMGSTGESSCFGPTLNPWDKERVPGGSSSGSAAAVAEGSAFAALGTDTGGSVRQPAALCGLVGIKPTYGRVSRYGATAMASSFDQVGSLARTVADAATVLGVIEGHDAHDATSVTLRDEQKLRGEWGSDLKGLRLGVPRGIAGAGVTPGVRESFEKSLETLRGLGAEIVEIDLQSLERSLAVYYILMPSEVSANLARYDGIRYGRREAAENLDRTYRLSRGRGFGPEVRRRIMLGTYVLSAGYYDAYYSQAQKVRRLVVDEFTKLFQSVDAILTPTSPQVAWPLGQMSGDPLQMYMADIFTVPVNVAGVPAISLPCGLSEGLPVGLQIIGAPLGENKMLSIAYAYEQARGPFGLSPAV